MVTAQAGHNSCWKPVDFVERGGGQWRSLIEAAVLFDHGMYDGVSAPWKTVIAGHEWGHN